MKKTILSITLLTFTLISNAQLPKYVPSNGLIGWWSFNGNANDISNNGNNGTVNGASLTSDRFGSSSSAYNFDGKSNFIEIPNTSNLNLNTDFTISSWFYADSMYDVPGTVKMILSKNRNGILTSGYAYGIWNNNYSSSKRGMINFSGAPKFTIETYPRDSSGDVIVNKWYNYTVSYSLNSKELRYYINGNLIDTQMITFAISSNTQNLIIGGEWQISGSGKKNFFNGKIDDIGIWNRVLTPQEVIGLTSQNQKNCKLINSATFTVPGNSKTEQISSLNVVPNQSYSIDTGQWIHIAYTKSSNNTSKLYKNGVLQATGTYLNLNYNWSRIDIGAFYYTSYNAWFKGLFDELRISNTERTASEILTAYNSNSPFIKDNNTIGLYHFDENSGSTTNGVVGASGSIINAQWVSGKFGSCLSYNGINTRTQINQSVPSSAYTIEFWLYVPNLSNNVSVISTYGMNTNNFVLYKKTTNVSYNWSTGATGNSITINPQNYKYIWVTDGNCYDTVWFESDSKTQFVTHYDTVKLSTYDTLYIKVNTGTKNNPVFNSIKVYPNPSSTHIIIENGNYSTMGSYTAKIVNSIGQQVFQSSINQQQFVIDVKSIGSSGVYTLYILDNIGNTVGVKKIILQ